MTRLPIDDHVEEIAALADSRGAAVVVAPPGAGKTTRVPPALAAAGKTILLQPRRVAARALARRIAEERGWTLGREVGWHVRFDRRFTADTRLVVATEGILTARLRGDPLLSDFRTVVLDEFHERSLHADLALALVKQAIAARRDLRLVVMSATLDARRVADYLGGCPIVEVPGRTHPIEIEYRPRASPAEAVREALRRPGGCHVLCFLPGAPEIARLAGELRGLPPDVRVLPLHGSLDAEAQDAALAPTAGRKVILATNLAETSLTVEGVTDVIDTGRHKVLRCDAAIGVDRLEAERISRDSAEQRAGRAGRTGPGRVLRLWDPREELRPHREPEIERVDLASPLLEVLAWGGDPRTFDWFEQPPRERMEAALALLERLGATESGKVTALGQRLARFPLHPRLARVLLDCGGSRPAAAACAVLAERWVPPGLLPAAASDLLARADRIREAPFHVQRAAEELAAIARGALDDAEPRAGEEDLLRALFAAFPDRVARRREAGSPRLLLASGSGATLARESCVHDGEFLVALDVSATDPRPGAEAIVRAASRVERSWLGATRREVVHTFDPGSGAVRAVERAFHEAIPLGERSVPPDPARATALLVEALRARGPSERATATRRRLAFAGIEVDLDALLARACAGRTTLPDDDPRALFDPRTARELDRRAPETLAVPSGRSIPLEYREDGSVVASVKLQELFGLAETPRLGARGEPVTFSLLAPNGRPVQTTRDLRSFWERTYPEVRKELRGRYPKHPWPEDPWTAKPTARAKPRPRSGSA